jgi:mannose-6-phosphate isomerase class I
MIWRKTSQTLLPARRVPPVNHYDIYPAAELAPGALTLGFDALARRIAVHTHVVIDGFPGVMWESLRAGLNAALTALDVNAQWTRAEDALKSEAEIAALIAPALGGDDPLFGTRFQGALRDFFARTPAHAPAGMSGAPKSLEHRANAGVAILYGCGAALATCVQDPACLLIYLDVPKNEVQFRARAGTACHIGAARTSDPKTAYKRCYFVDWVAANRHRAAVLPRIDVLVDTQRPDEPVLISGDQFRIALNQLAHGVFRPRPWFEPGPWGGQWIKKHMPQLPQDAPNYAWSFELISPENGLLFASDTLQLEASFDWLMHAERDAVLGEFAHRFGDEFPIRFDFLDTVEGGNLSLQCHPRPDYIRRHFGERITQDETYYMLDVDTDADARVYLGFREGIDPAAFRAALEHSHTATQPLDVEAFVNALPARKHDLFLIPNGTVHCAGQGCLVLEISATPYIFTFKMYDWLRLDLDGRPRPLNIARAFDNLYFERAGERVTHELIAKQRVIAQGEGWTLTHCPTHAHHFYDVHRIELNGTIEIATQGSPHVLSLVEGANVRVTCANGADAIYRYAETFVIPAAACTYRLSSPDGAPIKVVKAFLKPGRDWVEGAVL